MDASLAVRCWVSVSMSKSCVMICDIVLNTLVLFADSAQPIAETECMEPLTKGL